MWPLLVTSDLKCLISYHFGEGVCLVGFGTCLFWELFLLLLSLVEYGPNASSWTWCVCYYLNWLNICFIYTKAYPLNINYEPCFHVHSKTDKGVPSCQGKQVCETVYSSTHAFNKKLQRGRRSHRTEKQEVYGIFMLIICMFYEGFSYKIMYIAIWYWHCALFGMGQFLK